MEALQKQEDVLKGKLEDASSITERRTIRGELREIRRKIQDLEVSKDENANTISPKHEINGAKDQVDTKKGSDAKVQVENSKNELKSNSSKSGLEYKINDDTPDLKVKSADERANRRAKRQERMARLAKEQTEDDTGKVLPKKDETIKQEKNDKTLLSNGIKESKDYAPKQNEEKEKKQDSIRPWSQRFGRDAPKSDVIESKKSSENSEVKNSSPKPYVPSTERKVDVKTTPVDTPQSLVSKTERKEERTFMQRDKQSENIKQTIEQKSVIDNKQQTTYTTKTTNRFSNSMDRIQDSTGQNGPQADKQRAAKAIGKALNVGALRDRFAAVDKQAPGKPGKTTDFGLNFNKKNDKPGYTVKTFAEIKAEQKTTTTKPADVGLSSPGSKGQNQAGTRSGLRETGLGSNYKKTTPDPHPRHQTAPAAPAGNSGFSLPGGGRGGASVADRMKMFREAQQEENARVQKQKEKEQQRARLASDPTGNKTVPQPSSANENRTAPCMKKREKKKPVRRTMSISSIVLDWCREMVKDYGINITNFSGCWSNGLAFCALIHKFNPDKFDFNELNETDRARNFNLAFDTAFEVKKIPKLLDVEDMVRMEKPEPRSVQCYVQWIWSVYGPTSGYGPSQDEIKEAAKS